MENKNKPVIFVVGPTASGKSSWALKLAQEFNGVIVNCDSLQLYKKLDIGTAKPSPEERSIVPHHLFDYVLPPIEMSAGMYSRDFFECVESLPEKKPIFVVGGTGFYFMAIEKGMYPVLPVPEEIKHQILAEMGSSEGQQNLYNELLGRDPEYAQKIHVSDLYRIGRAIELIRSQKKSVTQIQNEFSASRAKFPYPLLKIGLQWEREDLSKRIFERTQKMLDQGFVEEVRGLLDESLGSWSPLSSVGYKEVIKLLDHQILENDLLGMIAQSTRQLAKRQRTWFQRDKDILWFQGGDGFELARAQVEKFLILFDPHHGKV
jgi:tRNA dimethylallyltransferase